ncbi:unnamed protein product, partial [Ectocarpus fasciculatus]
RDAKKWVSEIKFSKDGRFLAAGAHDNSIYMYSVPQQFKRKFKFTKHNSYITHFDFSADSSVMQSNCGGYELLFCETNKGSQVSKGSTLSEKEWATWTCPLGWPVLGIWPPGADGTDINAVDRAPSGAYIATADDFGKLKLFRYPCVVEKSKFVEFSGHSSHVTNVRWGPTDSWLITTGGNDKCVFQWRNRNTEPAAMGNKTSRHGRSSAPSLQPTGEEEEDIDEGPEMSGKSAALGEDPPDASYADLARSAEVVWDRLCDSGHIDTSLPESDELILDHVFGYRGFDCRNNLFYVSGSSTDRSVVYPAASLGVVTNSNSQKQNFLRGHTDDIVSMCAYLGPNGGDTLVATGQMGPGPIHVWSFPTMSCKATIVSKQKSVNNLAFSRDGRLLISIAEDNSVCVSEWMSQRVIVTVAGEPAATHHLATSDDPKSLFLSCGNKHIRVWSLSGRNLTSSMQLLLTGSKRGTISIWSADLSPMHSFLAKSVMVNKIALTAGQIQSISPTVVNDSLYLVLGTRGCDIIEVKCDLAGKSQQLVDTSLEVRGHCNDELWGLACHPKKPQYITVGDDKTLKKWSIHEKKLIMSVGLGIMARACCYDPAGNLIAVGFGGRVGCGKQKADGTVRVYDENTLDLKCEMRDAKQWIGDIKFSPDGQTLAVASHNNSIYLYAVSRSAKSAVSLSLRSKFSKHNSYITHFDFSADSRFIQSNCGAYELLFSNASSGKQITSASELKDVKWATWTCTLGWPVQGIWPPAADGTDVNAVDRSHSGHLVATSDDFGKVSLIRYP